MKHSQIPAARRMRRGFTLLEVLIVLAILGVIAAMVVPELIGRQQGANEDATRLSLSQIEGTLELYASDNNGEYPQGGQEVLEMLTQTQTDQVTGRNIPPYLDTIPLDAWQNPFFYEYPNSRIERDKPAIWSAGRDGKNDDGSGDDINNWDQYLR